MASTQFSRDGVWNVVSPNVSGDAAGNIQYFFWPGNYVYFLDSAPGGGADPSHRAFVLFAPGTTNKLIKGLLSLMKTEKIASGFMIAQAFSYRKVFVVDPKDEFTQAELLPLQTSGSALFMPNTTDVKILSDFIQQNL